MSEQAILDVPAGKALKIASSRGTEYIVKAKGRLKRLTTDGLQPISRGGVIKKADDSTYCEYVPESAARDATLTHQPAGRHDNAAPAGAAMRYEPQTSPTREGSRAPRACSPTEDDLDAEPLVAPTDDTAADRNSHQPRSRSRLNAQ